MDNIKRGEMFYISRGGGHRIAGASSTPTVRRLL